MRDYLVFYLNGKKQTLRDDAALGSLADLLRERLGHVGTKVVCNEGDCGACSVLVGRPSEDGSQLIYQTLDACIAFPFQLDRTHIVSIEGLMDSGKLSPVQDAMVRCHGSQCGFCTPGFVVALHGIVESEAGLTNEALRYELSGNLCRCTGYVSILEAGKSIDPTKVARLKQKYPEQPMLLELNELDAEPVQLSTKYGKVMVPSTIEQAVQFRAAHPSATIVSGATDYGVLRNHGKVQPGETLCLSSVQDFSAITIENDVLTIGGGATWRAIERFVEHLIPEYHAILARFGSPQIRNAGTLAGNLASGSPIADSVPFHIVTRTEIELRSLRGSRRVPIADFYTGYRKTVLAEDELITSIHTPLPKANEWIKLYKISKRRDMDISTVTLGIWLNLEGDSIREVRLALGGVGPAVMRMTSAENCLAEKRISEAVFREAGLAARQAITPWSDVRGGADYRLQLVENLLVKCFHELSFSNPSVASSVG